MSRPLDPRLLRYAHGVRTLLIGSVGVASGTAILVVAQAFCLGDIVSRVFLGGADLADVRDVLGLLALVVLGRALLATVGETLAQRAATRTSAQLRAALLGHVVRLGPVWLSGERRGQVATLATRGVDSVEPYVARYLPQLVIAVIVPLTVGVAILTQDFVAAVIVAVTAPLIPLFMALIGTYTQSATAKQWTTLGVLSGHFLDVVAGLPTLKAFGRERAQSQRMAEIDKRYRTATLGVLRVSFLSSFVLELLATVSVAVVAVSIGLRLVDGSLDLRTGLTVLILAPEVYLPIRQVGAQFHAAADGIDAAEQVFAILATEPARHRHRHRRPHRRRGRRRRDRHLPGRRRRLARPRVADPPRRPGHRRGGSVRRREVDAARDAAGVRRPDVRRRAHRWRGWRRPRHARPDRPGGSASAWSDRTRCSSGPPSPTTCACAARRPPTRRSTRPCAPPASTRPRCPDGALTRVGDLASDVSAGQRRRVALARVLLDPPALVLLDEPTAGLDDATEVDVVDAIRRLADAGAAVVVVAHRPSLVAGADEIVELDPVAVGA